MSCAARMPASAMFSSKRALVDRWPPYFSLNSRLTDSWSSAATLSVLTVKPYPPQQLGAAIMLSPPSSRSRVNFGGTKSSKTLPRSSLV